MAHCVRVRLMTSWNHRSGLGCSVIVVSSAREGLGEA